MEGRRKIKLFNTVLHRLYSRLNINQLWSSLGNEYNQVILKAIGGDKASKKQIIDVFLNCLDTSIENKFIYCRGCVETAIYYVQIDKSERLLDILMTETIGELSIYNHDLILKNINLKYLSNLLEGQSEIVDEVFSYISRTRLWSIGLSSEEEKDLFEGSKNYLKVVYEEFREYYDDLNN